MANFFAELKRRHIYRVAVTYVLVAWVLLQLFNNLTPVMKLPDWAGTLVLVLLVGGFPIALLFAWVRELPETNLSPQRATITDWALIGVLLVVVGLISYQEFASVPATTIRQEAGVVGARQTAAAPAGISVAVLPFLNLSSDKEQEFFSDGITEEITSALAKIPDLTVIGRTSAFQFKGQNRDLRAIGQALSAGYLIEGSVRKAGDRVRITAQLIRVESGAHLWTENYDRQLTDIFAIQENIAQAIAGALRLPLGLKQGESLVSNRTVDTETYEQFLRAKSYSRIGGDDQTISILEPLIARNPGFAPAWALLANAYNSRTRRSPAAQSGAPEEAARVLASYPKQEAAAQRAIELDPRDPDGYSALGLLDLRRGKLVAAEELYSKALMLDPNNPRALLLHANLLLGTGHLKEGLMEAQRSLSVEPFDTTAQFNASVHYWMNGENDAAIALLGALPVNFFERAPYLAHIYAVAGRYRDAVDVLNGTPIGVFLPGTVEAAITVLRTAPARATSPQSLARLGWLGFAYLSVGAPDRVLEFYEAAAQGGYAVAVYYAALWHPAYAVVRKTERFRTFVRNAGLVEYWRAKGWPDLCHPVGADDFVCE
jgi:TolB-like protein